MTKILAKAVYKAYPVKLTSKPDIEMAIRVAVSIILILKFPDHNRSIGF